MPKGARDHITVHCCLNANGECIPPMIIFEKCFPSTAYVKEGIRNTLYAKSTNGLMDEELFFKWLADHFIQLTNHLGKRILFIDCHPPSHTTHVFQPFDVSMYKPLKNQ